MRDLSIMVTGMEHVLRKTLLDTATLFATAKGCALSTIGRRCKNDSAFFVRLHDTSQTFTMRTFDEVMGWLFANWPEGSDKPFDLVRWDNERKTAA